MARFSKAIAENFTHPRNVGELTSPDASALVADSVCGDQIRLTARLADGRIAEARFLAHGCAAALGTASIMTEWIIGMKPTALLELDEAMVTTVVGGLAPGQSHCASLAVSVLRALADSDPGTR
jgi:nitrogen fixation NifU-like protein